MINALQFCAWLLLPWWLYFFKDKRGVDYMLGAENIVTTTICAIVADAAAFCIIMAIKTAWHLP